MTNSRLFRKLATSIFASVIIVASGGIRALAAPNYSCGTYGSGSYNENCPDATAGSSSNSSSSSSSASSTDETTAEDGASVLLNDFTEYGETVGKDLSLESGQIVYFNVNVNGADEKHSITVKEVGKDYVILTFASTPTDVRINVGETIKQDVTGTSDPDIEVRLNSITDGVADLTFRQYSANVTTPIPAKTATVAVAKKSSPWMKVLIIVIALMVGIFVLWYLLNRRKKRTTPGPQNYNF